MVFTYFLETVKRFPTNYISVIFSASIYVCKVVSIVVKSKTTAVVLYIIIKSIKPWNCYHLQYYDHTLWQLYQLNHIEVLEKVQRRATKYILSDYTFNYKHLCVFACVLSLGKGYVKLLHYIICTKDNNK